MFISHIDERTVMYSIENLLSIETICKQAYFSKTLRTAKEKFKLSIA
jgi:hypothetical protein